MNHYTLNTPILGSNVTFLGDDMTINATSPVVSIVLKGKLYNINLIGLKSDYVLYGESIDFIKNYDTHNPTFQLPIVMKPMTNHVGWVINDVHYGINDYVTILPEHFGNVDIIPKWEEKKVTVENGKSYEVVMDIDVDTYDYIIYDLTNASSNVRISINSGVEHVRLLGDGELITNFFFGVFENDVIVDLEHCYLLGRVYNAAEENQHETKTNSCVVDMTNSKGSTINLYQDSTILQNYSYRSDSTLRGALMTSNVTIQEKTPNATLTLYGADGNGLNAAGGNAWVGPKSLVNETISIKADINCYGGNGANGLLGTSYGHTRASEGVDAKNGTNGTKGSASGTGLLTKVKIEVAPGYTLAGFSGKPGNGGAGGSGQHGANAVWFGSSSLPGGNGGRGGDGGSGLASIVADTSSTGNILCKAGMIGWGGAGGSGGVGGTPLAGALRPSGSTGANGTSYAAAAKIEYS